MLRPVRWYKPVALASIQLSDLIPKPLYILYSCCIYILCLSLPYALRSRMPCKSYKIYIHTNITRVEIGQRESASSPRRYNTGQSNRNLPSVSAINI